MDMTISVLLKHNTIACPLSGLPVRALRNHFLIEANETYLITDMHHNVKIVGKFRQWKHKEKVLDCQTYICPL